jgi:hypothetical protein
MLGGVRATRLSIAVFCPAGPSRKLHLSGRAPHRLAFDADPILRIGGDSSDFIIGEKLWRFDRPSPVPTAQHPTPESGFFVCRFSRFQLPLTHRPVVSKGSEQDRHDCDHYRQDHDGNDDVESKHNHPQTESGNVCDLLAIPVPVLGRTLNHWHPGGAGVAPRCID